MKDDNLSLVLSRFELAKKDRKSLDDKWNKYYRLYRSYQNPRTNKYQANLFIPYAFSNVETVIPRMVAQRPKVNYVAQKPADEGKVDVLNNLVQNQWDKMDGDVKIAEWVKECLIYGTAFLKTYWLWTKDGYDDPVIEPVDIFDVFVDPDATNVDNAEYIIHKTMVDLDEVKKTPAYSNTSTLTTFEKTQDDGREERLSIQGRTPVHDKNKNKVELLEYWENGRIITVANRIKIIRDEKNPFKHGKKPFIVIKDYDIPHEFYGVGEIESIESLQDELNSLRNQIQDNNNLILNKMWKARKGTTVDWETVVSKPGGIILVDQMDDIIQLETQDIAHTAVKIEELIKSDIQQASGVTDYAKGTEGVGLNDTATGVSLQQEAANQRFFMKVRNFERMGIKRLGELLLGLNQQYLDKDRLIKIVGPEGTQYDVAVPQDIQALEVDVYVEADSSLPVDKTKQRREAIELFERFRQDPDINQRKLKEKILKAFGIDNISEYMNSPEQSVMAEGQDMEKQMILKEGGMGGEQQQAPQGMPQPPQQYPNVEQPQQPANPPRGV